MSKRRVLVVEDDLSIRRGIVDALSFDGYEVLESGVYEQALRMAREVGHDLLLLDLVLPGGDGLELLSEVRLARPTLPVIILTARGSEDDRVQGLRLGADDYVVKPFSVKELLARVEAVLRRSAERPTDVIKVEFAGGVADLLRCELVFQDGERAELSEKEIALLRYLAKNSGRAISRDELLSNVWRLPASNVRTRTIDMHVARLRDKLRDDGGEAKVILTIRGKGYLFKGSAVA